LGDAPNPLRSPLLDGVAHGFMTREGGVSTGIVAGLNVGRGAGDDGAIVAENRRRAAESVLPGGQLVSVYQVHSADCATVDEPWDEDNRPHADALVTNRPGLVLGIVTADCAPVLLADRDAGVIGAAHAGWKGAHGGVIESTVAAMERLGARRGSIAAVVGPCIAQASYEVSEDFRAQFPQDEDAKYFTTGPRAGHYQFDLAGYVVTQLQHAGIGAVEALNLDTYSDPARFYSFRRATHLSEENYGRQFSLIGLLG
jgi:hypothetical protein